MGFCSTHPHFNAQHCSFAFGGKHQSYQATKRAKRRKKEEEETEGEWDQRLNGTQSLTQNILLLILSLIMKVHPTFAQSQVILCVVFPTERNAMPEADRYWFSRANLSKGHLFKEVSVYPRTQQSLEGLGFVCSSAFCVNVDEQFRIQLLPVRPRPESF